MDSNVRGPPRRGPHAPSAAPGREATQGPLASRPGDSCRRSRPEPHAAGVGCPLPRPGRAACRCAPSPQASAAPRLPSSWNGCLGSQLHEGRGLCLSCFPAEPPFPGGPPHSREGAFALQQLQGFARSGTRLPPLRKQINRKDTHKYTNKGRNACTHAHKTDSKVTKTPRSPFPSPWERVCPFSI